MLESVREGHKQCLKWEHELRLVLSLLCKNPYPFHPHYVNFAFFFPSHFFFLCSYKSLVSGLRKPSFVNGPIRWHITDQLDIHPVLKYICDLEAPTRVVLTIHTWYYIKLIALTRNIVLLHIINRLGVHIILLSE